MSMARRPRPSPAVRRRRAARSAQLRRRAWTLLIGTAAILTVAVILTFALAPRAVLPDVERVDANPATVPNVLVAGYDHEQLVNAAIIIAVGYQQGMTTRDQAIAVMTAMGESSLRNLGHGDYETRGVRNPDGTPTTSLGLFQQQASWGDSATRRDPAASAKLFYDAMRRSMTAPERAQLPPSEVAHRVQVNADEHHYERYWDDAIVVLGYFADGARG